MFRELETIANMNEKQYKSFERFVRLLIRAMDMTEQQALTIAMNNYIMNIKDKKKKQ